MVNVSALLPVYNDAEGLRGLLPAICAALDVTGRTYELVIVDQGSSADERRRVAAIAADNRAIRLLRLRSPAGRGEALMAGVAAARGSSIVCLECSLRYAPQDIGPLLERLNRADLVMGCRRVTRFSTLVRAAATAPRRLLFGFHGRDPGCAMWAARREAIADLNLRGWRSALLAEWVVRRGFRVGQQHVNYLCDAQACRRPWARPHWRNAPFLGRSAAPIPAVEVAIDAAVSTGGRMRRIDPPQRRGQRGGSSAPGADRTQPSD